MKTRKAVIVILGLVFLLAVMGCQTLRGGGKPDDKAIRMTISTKIATDPQLGFMGIEVKSYEGDVILSGTVPDKETRDRLIEMAESVRGVKSVTSNLKIEME
jgi:hyperosmotically inducible protein